MIKIGIISFSIKKFVFPFIDSEHKIFFFVYEPAIFFTLQKYT